MEYIHYINVIIILSITFKFRVKLYPAFNLYPFFEKAMDGYLFVGYHV